jgi:hypothetical protein
VRLLPGACAFCQLTTVPGSLVLFFYVHDMACGCSILNAAGSVNAVPANQTWTAGGWFHVGRWRNLTWAPAVQPGSETTTFYTAYQKRAKHTDAYFVWRCGDDVLTATVPPA